MVDSRGVGYDHPELFRIDAKAEDDFFVLGGWELSTQDPQDLKKARRFSLRVDSGDMPYLFKDGKAIGT